MASLSSKAPGRPTAPAGPTPDGLAPLGEHLGNGGEAARCPGLSLRDGVPSTRPGSLAQRPAGTWRPAADTAPLDPTAAPAQRAAADLAALHALRRPVFVVQTPDGPRLMNDGVATIGTAGAPGDPAGSTGGVGDFGHDDPPERQPCPLLAYAPPLHPEQLGDAAFRRAAGVRLAYVAGEMANGIASCELVEAMGRAGMIGFFGAAGLSLSEVEAAIDRLQRSIPDLACGFNLIHSPAEPAHELATADLYIRRGVRRVCASAYLGLTLPVVKYRVAGIHLDPAGRVVAPNRLLAKVSRVEVARHFMAPPPDELLAELVRSGFLSPLQARLAATLPLAEDITAEADSGGHTDNRPALALLPTMLALRDELQARYGFAEPIRVGAAGGIATPASVAAAFAMGAAYVVSGSINQACREAGTSDAVRQMLAEAGPADVAMAPAADMFEMGVKVQVLKRGTLFAQRARKLYELYVACPTLEDIPAAQRAQLERDYFRQSLADEWAATRAFFARRDPSQIERAERDPKHKLALVFRSYLGRSSDWANRGEAGRKADYQVWCGPAMGAFNEWVRGSFLEAASERRVATLGLNLMTGAAVLTRVAWLRAQGVALPPEAQRFAPRPAAELTALLESAEGTT